MKTSLTQGIHIEDNAKYITIVGNVIDGVNHNAGDCSTCNDGIHIIDGDYISVIGNTVRGADDAGINLAVDGTSGPTNVTVVGNTVTASGGPGIKVGSNSSVVTEVVVDGNVTTANTGDGISLFGSGTTFRVSNNISRRNTGYGLNTPSGTPANYTVFGNFFDSNTAGATNALPATALLLGNVGGQYAHSRLNFGCSGTPTSSATLFLQTMSVACTATSENSARLIAPAAGTLRNLAVHTSGTVVTGTVFTVRKNQIDTALACTVAAAGSTCTNVADAITVVATDRISVKFVTGAGETFIDPKVAFEY
jgi:hypothetical protein